MRAVFLLLLSFVKASVLLLLFFNGRVLTKTLYLLFSALSLQLYVAAAATAMVVLSSHTRMQMLCLQMADGVSIPSQRSRFFALLYEQTILVHTSAVVVVVLKLFFVLLLFVC